MLLSGGIILRICSKYRIIISFLFILAIVNICAGCGKVEIIDGEQPDVSVHDEKEVKLSSDNSIDYEQTDGDKFDWKSLEQVMTVNEYKDFCRYSSVIDGIEKVKFFIGEKPFDYKFEEICDAYYISDINDFNSVFVVDLDNKNGKELILGFSTGGGGVLIFSEIDDKYYGTYYGNRCFQYLQEDGKYMGSGGAGDEYFHTVEIEQTGFDEKLLAERHSYIDDNQDYHFNLTSNGELVEDYKKWLEDNYSTPAKGYILPSHSDTGEIEIWHQEKRNWE